MYAPGLSGAPFRGSASYTFASEPQPAVEYKFVFDFNGAAPQATLSLGTGFGKANRSLSGDFDARGNADLMTSFAHAQRVTATVYEGERQIAQSTFELAPDRRAAGLEAFARKVQANDPSLCHAASGPPLPVPPAEVPRPRF
jgi:hypothetical protein